MRQSITFKAPEVKRLVLDTMTKRKLKVIYIDCRSFRSLIELPDKSGRLIMWWKGVDREQMEHILNRPLEYIGDYLKPGQFNTIGKKPLN